MSAQLEFYRVRAAEARAGAAAATLYNVRQRWLLSEAAWTDLAERAERAEALHESLVTQKSNERAALIAAGQS
jgi:hypothetical protein